MFPFIRVDVLLWVWLLLCFYLIFIRWNREELDKWRVAGWASPLRQVWLDFTSWHRKRSWLESFYSQWFKGLTADKLQELKPSNCSWPPVLQNALFDETPVYVDSKYPLFCVLYFCDVTDDWHSSSHIAAETWILMQVHDPCLTDVTDVSILGSLSACEATDTNSEMDHSESRTWIVFHLDLWDLMFGTCLKGG